MAEKPKKRIDYAGWSVDIFSNDIKIDKLLNAQSWVGFGIYFYLCQMAFGSKGYYYEWCYDLCATTARKMGGGVGAGTVKETVDYCFQIGLFDKRLFDGWGVLTSRGIQKSYLAAIKGRVAVEIYKEYWLLDISKNEDYQGIVFVRKNSQNDDVQGEDGHALGANDDNNIIENSIVLNNKNILNNKNTLNNKNILCKTGANALFERLWKLYPCKRGKGKVTEKKKMELLAVGEEQMLRCIERYKTELKKDADWRKPQNGSTFFNSGYIDYLDDNFVPTPASGKKRSKFHNFEERNYDMKELERQLIDRPIGG